MWCVQVDVQVRCGVMWCGVQVFMLSGGVLGVSGKGWSHVE